MLRSLEIRDILLIDRLELNFGPGLNVLTGETGAGKSILLDCLGFVLGWRGRAELVRTGAAQGEVTAAFDLPPGHPSRAILEEAGIDTGDELILRRVNTTEGRKTAWVNDRRVTGEVLRALSETLVELHGQHDDRGLLNPRGHRQLLDAFAGLDLVSLREAWSARRLAQNSLTEAEARLEQVRTEEDFLRYAVKELDDFVPETGEDEHLDSVRRAMQAAERIREDVLRAAEALGPDGAEGAMLDANRWLEGVSDKAEGRLEGAVSALSRALVELGEASSGIENALQEMSFDPYELEATEERLFALRALARKHDCEPDDLPVLADNLRARLADLDAGEDDLTRLQAAVSAADRTYMTEADRIRAERAKAAERLDAAMAAELAPLKMERAIFETRLSDAEPGPKGHDAVSFTVATNPGAPAGPLDRIASGGELSRFLLALKVSLARGNDALTLIFDEIDRGIGGATADAVGRRLARLADGAQVLVVTHSPQVAAFGSVHFRVVKQVEGNMTTSSVMALNTDERIDEIARMLSGEQITDAARDAARALIG